MSLKHFHLVFLLFAILVDAGFFLWTRLDPAAASRIGATSLGMFAGWIALALTAYGVWYVVRKSPKIIIE
jgi:uncharacterized membrane protein